MSPRPQHCPYSPEPKKYGSEAQSPLPVDTSRRLDDKEIKSVQKIVGSILYYARAVDMTVLMSLSTIASEQTKGTERTMEKALQVLDYLATHPDAKVRFSASDMILNIHSNASYLTEPKSRQSRKRPFFPRVVTSRRQAHSIERGVPHAMFDPAICCVIRRRGRIGRTFSQLSRRSNFSTYPRRSRTSTAKNPSAL